MKSLHVSSASFAAALVYLSATAAQASAPELDPVVVVADRTPTPISRTGQSVTVLDAADIQSSQAIGVAEVLQTTPGATFARTGGPGQPTSVFIRGADSDHTLVLIDGVEMDDPSQPAGNFDFANLLVGVS